MYRVTPATEHYWYAGQVCDERNHLLHDLETNPAPYLTHADPLVRCFADWTLELFGLRVTRDLPLDYCEKWNAAQVELDKLYKRLRLVGCGEYTCGI